MEGNCKVLLIAMFAATSTPRGTWADSNFLNMLVFVLRNVVGKHESLAQ